MLKIAVPLSSSASSFDSTSSLMLFFSRADGVINQKRARRTEAVASAAPYTEADHGQYIRATASEIVKNIRDGKWTASQVVDAYIARAALAHRTTNCATEIMFKEARHQAQELDKEYQSSKTLRGPLHGVPLSIKDQLDVTGFDSSVGYSQWTNRPASEDAKVVALLRSAGAIPIMKTNVPQTMLVFECSNPVWGCTTNPWNERYTPGGSSGGEGALLAMDGSVIGIGTDLGGSLRIPAAYCGIYSLKPSPGRASDHGVVDPNPGFNALQGVVGPMARSIDDLELFCKIAFGAEGPCGEVAPIPYRQVSLSPKLRFGYYTSDDYIKASPANKRAVLETVDALRKQGHECIEFKLPEIDVMRIFAALLTADGYKRLLSHLGPDKQEKSLFLATLGPRLPGFLRIFASWIIETFADDNLFADGMRVCRAKSTFDFQGYIIEKKEYIKLFYQEVWDKYNFDGIICPVQATPVIRHGDCSNLATLAVGTIFYNIIDSPAGVIPVTRVDPEKDQLTEEWTNGPGHGSKLFEHALYRMNPPVYDPESMKGMPVAVQIVGKRWDDEKVLAMMRLVDEALGPRGFGPGCWNKEQK